MARTAHYRAADTDSAPAITVRDDRGIPVTELELQHDVDGPNDIDGELLAAGFNRSADWSKVDDGWVAPVVPAD
ncbi:MULTISPECIES: hypothetical protein [Prauserella salsuginis group]|uniref:Uncharacterized protein n=2 Tax=Prauserella salsuginis group TaxID=2893672 RepID=A0A839XGV3_9PSEU|nr:MULTISPECIES: hypothetical protein [Prauserella salsuginis group]MBB3663202.1 hypothetical protein [Prauserella sediminis]MCR3720971.1 hypothetical protein [Prauserella flava]MCR3734948.1 hypothetical protein [Prauserella salsuginis]